MRGRKKGGKMSGRAVLGAYHGGSVEGHGRRIQCRRP